jgi:hypothetical protein
MCMLILKCSNTKLTSKTVMKPSRITPGSDPGRGGGQGRIQEGGARGPAPPPKIGKNMIFWRKIVIFHTKYPKNFRSA